MKNINEDLVRAVFQAIVEVKPSLSKFLDLDEDEDEADLDFRLLADQIIKGFPWPIGVELRRLFSGEMRDLNRSRLDQLFKTIERTVQFISFVMVIELHDAIREKKIKPNLDFLEQFRKRFLSLSLGDFVWIIRSIGTTFSKKEIEHYVPELGDILTGSFYKTLEFWVPERNEIGHYQINLNQEEIEKRCVEYSEKLTNILTRISFLVKYKLVTIREIKVLKSRGQSAKYAHLMDILNSSDSDFRSRDEVFDSFSDSQAVLLMRNIKEPNDFLNLSPLVIDTRPEKIDAKEKFHLKKDIFLYTKFRDDKIFYVGTEVTSKCDLTYLSNYDLLMKEFHAILRSMESSTAA